MGPDSGQPLGSGTVASSGDRVGERMDDSEVGESAPSWSRRGVVLAGGATALVGLSGAFEAFAAPSPPLPARKPGTLYGSEPISIPGRKPIDIPETRTQVAALPGRKPADIPPRGRDGEATTRGPIGRAPAKGRHQVRTLNLYNVHTGEKVNQPYWADGRYVPETMRAITRLLRDHRAGLTHRIDPRLIELMHAIQGRLGRARPLEIVSGYRSPQTNEMLRNAGYGVAENSFHLSGQAVDIRVPGYRVSQISRIALALRRGGVGTYGRSNFLHVDVGPFRTW